MMGRISAEKADVTIITDDNPAHGAAGRDPQGDPGGRAGAREIGDRAEAIRAAVAMLRKGDVLVIAGKGHEEGQIVGVEVLPFSDHEAARAAIREAGGKVTG